MIVLALDPGNSVGYAVLEKNDNLNLSLVKTGVIKYHKQNKEKNSKELQKLLSLFKPSYAAFEESGSFLAPIYKQIIEESCKIFGVPTLGCKVQDVRESLYGNPNASKQETIDIIKRNL